MHSSSSNSLPPIILALICCSFGRTTIAADVNNEVSWFLNLAKANNGKTFCAPPTTTIGELGKAVSKFSNAHPELHDQLTDQQTIQALAESYPCKVQFNSELAHTEISKLGGKTVEVAPTGEFSSIDTKPTIAIMNKLHSTLAHENDSLVEQIKRNPGDYMPPALFALADLLYRQGDIDNAIFWFNAARVRGLFDAALCTDVSARSAIPAIVQQIPRDLIKRQFDDIPKLKNTIDRVLKWDEATPYNYDHRWISLHGMRAINSGMGNAASSAPLMVSRDSWTILAKKNRDQYRTSFDQAIDTVQKQRATK